jgi:SAM-dependent methyltransferase
MTVDYIIREGIIHIRKIADLTQKHGIVFALRVLILTALGYYYYKIFNSGRTFTFQKRTYSYFYHHYNVTWMGERAIEIPIIENVIKEYNGKRILEVGNVLNHYFDVNHDVVDKHEKDRNVINVDVVDFMPDDKYDLIISISTLEHVGWDEHLLYHRKEPQKTKRAFENLKRCLSAGGEMIITYPVGYNPNLDRLTDTGEIKWTRLLCMKRVSHDNCWVEKKWSEVRREQYDCPYIAANGLVIGYFKKSNNSRMHACSL